MEEHIPVKMMTSHPQTDDHGSTVWNVGTSFNSKKKGFSYSVIKFHKSRPEETGMRTLNRKDTFLSMVIENAEIISSMLCYHKSIPSYYHSIGLTTDHVVVVGDTKAVVEGRAALVQT